MVTATELSEKYDVSVRTIYRDIKKLEEAGIPILTIEGKGYAMMDGYIVEPVQFTEREANALITAELLVNQSSDQSFKAAFKDVLTKIKSVFQSSVQAKSEFLHSKIHVFENKDHYISSNVLSEIQMAITNFRQIEINYRKLNTTQDVLRIIEPCAFYSGDNRWILIAWCHLRKDYRAFRIDRIQSFKLLDQTFEDRQFSIQAYFMADDYSGHSK